MKISKFEVSYFRSITKTESIEFGQYNVLIGANNVGKSNLINALVLALDLVKKSSYSKMLKGDRRGFIDVDRNQYLWERDFPINIKNPKGKQTTFKITFELDNQETDEIRSARGLNIYKYITLVFYFDKDNIGNYDVSMRGKANKIYNSNTNKQFIAQYIAQNLNPIYVPCVRPAEMSDEAFEEAFKERLREKLDTDTEYKNCLQIIQEKQTMILQELEEELEETIKKYIPKVEAVRYERISTSGHRMVIPARGHLYIDDGVSTMLELKGDGIKSLTVRRHIVGGANRTLFSVDLPPRLCRTGTCRRLQTG